MGLFDIFKKRSKNKNTEPEKDQPIENNNNENEPVNAEPTKNEVNEPKLAPNDSQKDEPTTVNEDSNDSEEPKKSENLAAKDDDSEKTPDNSQTNNVNPDKTSLDTDDQSSAADNIESQNTESKDDKSDSNIAEKDNDSADSSLSDDQDKSELDKTSSVEEETNVDQAKTSDTPAEDSDNKEAVYERGLAKSRSSFGKKLNALFANFRSVDEKFFDDLEDTLIESDVGFETALSITDELRDEVKLRNVKKSADVQNVVIKKLIDLYDQQGNGESNAVNMASSGPTVILFVGVNGVGKTTTIGKMAKMYKDEGKKVILAAADTFRAGAIEQLNVWAKRDGVDIVKGKEHGDPSAVVYDAVTKAKNENYDILLVDTAGRLQNKVNLMNELTKMKKVLTREIPDAPHEVLLVLDGTTGQNAMNQAKIFKEATEVTGIVLTKLDGTAKGGIVLAIRNELHLPVKYVGLGEKVTDLQVFDPNEFVYGLFKGLIS